MGYYIQFQNKLNYRNLDLVTILPYSTTISANFINICFIICLFSMFIHICCILHKCFAMTIDNIKIAYASYITFHKHIFFP